MRIRQRHDEGYTLILVAFLLTALLVFAAFAVDFGAVYNARRQDQSAADVAALAGALELDQPSAIAGKVKQVAHATLKTTFSDDDWNDPAKCPSPPSGFTVLTGARCIARDSDVRLWVHIPTSSIASTLGVVVGRSGYDHTAFAIAGYERDGFGGILPFGLFGAGSNISCIKQAAGSVKTANPSCDGTADATSGNFGTLDLANYGNSLIGTTPNCGYADSSRIPNNIAIGVDHKLVVIGTNAARYDTSPGVPTCPSKTPEPNGAYTYSGGNAGVTGEGLYSGTRMLPGNQGFRFSDGGLPRFQRYLAGEPSWMKSGGAHRTRFIADKNLDNIPLHEFIGVGDSTGPVPDIPASCQVGQFSAFPDVTAVADTVVRNYLESINNLGDRYEALWDRCLTHHGDQAWQITATEADGGGVYSEDPVCSTTCGGVIFGRDAVFSTEQNLFDIQYSPRFAYVPRLHETATSGADQVTFAAFVPIFLQRLYDGCSNSGSPCGLEFAPGVTDAGANPGNAWKDVSALTAIVLPASSLPGELGSDDAPFDTNVFHFLRLLR